MRLDTSERMVDQALWHEMGEFSPTGVEPRAGRARAPRSTPRPATSACGSWSPAASIAAKIRRFEALGSPVDAYGVGSSLVRGENDFTADVVRVDGRDCAKAGRRIHPNPRLERVE